MLRQNLKTKINFVNNLITLKAHAFWCIEIEISEMIYLLKFYAL